MEHAMSGHARTVARHSVNSRPMKPLACIGHRPASPWSQRAVSGRPSLDVASLSHPGMVRTHNEDSVFVDGEAGLAVLADGMGGYSAGEVASGIAVNVISKGMLEELNSGRELSKVDIGSGLTHAALLLQQQIALANKGIYEAAQARPECAGMGTTLVATVFFGTASASATSATRAATGCASTGSSSSRTIIRSCRSRSTAACSRRSRRSIR